MGQSDETWGGEAGRPARGAIPATGAVRALSEYLWRREPEEFLDCLDELARNRSRAEMVLALGGLRPCAVAHGE